jgi:hypothetical protein
MSNPWLGIDGLRGITFHRHHMHFVELGQAVGGSRDYRSGFTSRLAIELTRAKPISFTDQLPLIFRG